MLRTSKPGSVNDEPRTFLKGTIEIQVARVMPNTFAHEQVSKCDSQIRKRSVCSNWKRLFVTTKTSVWKKYTEKKKTVAFGSPYYPYCFAIVRVIIVIKTLRAHSDARYSNVRSLCNIYKVQVLKTKWFWNIFVLFPRVREYNRHSALSVFLTGNSGFE